MPCSIFRLVKLTVVSPHGKEAVIAILEPGSFFGEGCLAGQPVHLVTATTVEAARIVRIDKPSMLQLLKDDRTFSALFLAYILARNVRIQEDLVDQLFNSSEKRLTRERVVPIISASVSWLIFAMTSSGLPSFPKWAISNNARASRFSLELKS